MIQAHHPHIRLSGKLEGLRARYIRHLISTGTTERELLAAVARKFPELTLTEFVAALRDASGGATA